jgi:3'-5' exoribonuclease
MTPATPPTTAERRTVSDLRAGDTVDGVYLLAELQQRAKKNGDPYFFLTLRDATGSLQSVMWDNHDLLLAGTVAQNDFAHVHGHVAEYNGALQVTVKKVARVEDDSVDASMFLPSSTIPRAELERRLDALLETVENTDCRRLLDRFFGHKRLREMYCTAPAAARVHQAFIGGLLEHTLNVIDNALKIAENYKPFDRDLLVTAGLLHDIGKIREYDWRRAITYTDDGRLLGHIFMGASMVDSAIRELQRAPDGFSDHYHRQILHIILSHHGKLEYGSPIIPKTREALLLHYGDYTDAYMASFGDAVRESLERGQRWTPYNRLFESFLFTGLPDGKDADPAASPAAPGGGSVDDPG